MEHKEWKDKGWMVMSLFSGLRLEGLCGLGTRGTKEQTLRQANS